MNDQFLVTAITDHSLKVWDSFTGELVHILLVSVACMIINSVDEFPQIASSVKLEIISMEVVSRRSKATSLGRTVLRKLPKPVSKLQVCALLFCQIMKTQMLCFLKFLCPFDVCKGAVEFRNVMKLCLFKKK